MQTRLSISSMTTMLDVDRLDTFLNRLGGDVPVDVEKLR